jgi:hypothetical protein
MDCQNKGVMVEWIEKWWSDKPDERPFFRDIVEFVKKLHEGRPSWGQGGDDNPFDCPARRKGEGSSDSSVSKDIRIRSRESSTPFLL